MNKCINVIKLYEFDFYVATQTDLKLIMLNPQKSHKREKFSMVSFL